MGYEDYWKERYEHAWKSASEREERIAELLEEEIGRKVVMTGLGAGCTEFLSGNAESHGYEKGDPDLHIVDTSIYVEVSGPLAKGVDRDADLWIRPDKVENAKEHWPEHETWFLHCLAEDLTLRVVKLDEDFFKRVDESEFRIVRPRIRGTIETYLAIPADDPCVGGWEVLVDRLREIQ